MVTDEQIHTAKAVESELETRASNHMPGGCDAEFFKRRAAAIRALIDLANKLPLTADGVRVVPGMEVWLLYRSPYDGEHVCKADFDDVYVYAGMNEVEPKPGHWIGVYSTHEAAESALAAREGVGDAE